MAEIEPNDDDVFEIDDFTVVSPLETLVSALEVAIHDMNLEGSRTNYDVSKLPRDWELEMSEKRISYESNSFLVRWYRPNGEVAEDLSEVKDEEDEYEMRSELETERGNLNHYSAASHQISSPSLDFCTKNNICAMYGVAEFLVLLGEHATNDRIATLEQKDFVMSAVRIALNNTNCEIPFFVLCGPPEREMYFGSAESRTQTMTFLPAHLHQILPRHTNLTGLIALMKEKVRSRASVIDLEEVQASIRFEYSFKEPDRPRKSFIGDEKKLKRDCEDCRHALEMTLVCLWPHLPETRVHENESFSNLEPADSSHWEIYANFDTKDIKQPFSHILKTTLSHCLKDASPSASDLFRPPPLEEAANPDKSTTRLMEEMDLNKEDWSNLLGREVVSEVGEDDRRYPSWSTLASLQSQSTRNPLLAKCLDDLRHIKSAPPRSIAARLAIQISHVIEDESDVAVKWISFTRLLRQHWENNQELPGLSSVSAPNLGTCIFNQKIEMLQCCIRARLQRMEYYDNHANEEFFDAEEDLDEVKSVESERPPAGREKRMGDSNLLNHPDIPLYIPITQMPCPMTEDMVQAHAEHLSSLKEGTERQEAQLGLLRSDIQAFKAANPKCDFVDFIRWHSPKDFDEEKGEVSDRMRIVDNTWEICWKEAIPMQAIHQQPHFNDSSVAEGILSLFEHATVAEVCDWLLPILFHQTALQLINEDDAVLVEGEGSTMCLAINHATRDKSQPAKQKYYQALHLIRKYERLAHFHSHLWKTLWRQQFLKKTKEEDEIRRIIKEIMKESDRERVPDAMFRTGIHLKGAASHFLGEIIGGDFQGQNGLLRKNQIPSRKSYVLYWTAPVPSPSSRLQPQRIFANIEYDNHRICSATTNDSVFI